MQLLKTSPVLSLFSSGMREESYLNMSAGWEDLVASGLDFALVYFLASASGERTVFLFQLISFWIPWDESSPWKSHFTGAAWGELNRISRSYCSWEGPQAGSLGWGSWSRPPVTEGAAERAGELPCVVIQKWWLSSSSSRTNLLSSSVS